tara:strand:- start:136 stop:405 length:270 start_codon:yes stop_codon:yes gene_type:complete
MSTPLTKYQSDAIHAINPDAEFVADGIDDITWMNGTSPISKSDINSKASELQLADEEAQTEKENLKASAKAKLMSGEALTEEEANTIVI